jgi:hypothetical protein
LDECLLTSPIVYLKAIKSTLGRIDKIEKKYFIRLEYKKAQHPNAAVFIQLRSSLDPKTLTLESLSKELLQSRFKIFKKKHFLENT